MWVMTTDGFLSIVRHKDDPTMMMVRARVKEDLIKAFGADGVVEDEQADYRFRKAVLEEEVADYMQQAVAEISYTTGVKDRIDQKDPDRHRALYAVWDAFYTLQEKKYGKGRYSYTPISEPLYAEDAIFDPSDDEYLT